MLSVNRRNRILACAVAAVIAVPPPSLAANVTSTWIAGANGTYQTGANWDNGVPNNGGGDTYNAVIGDGSLVTLSGAAAVSGLTVANPILGTSALEIVDNSRLTIDTAGGAVAVANDGGIALSSTGNGSTLLLTGTGGGSVTLSGAGTLTMGNSSSNYIYSDTGEMLINGAGHTIEGSGNIGLGITGVVNNGFINANSSSGLTLDTTSFENNGSIIVAASGVLNVSTGTVIMGGTIENNGLISLGGAIRAASLTNAVTGAISVDSGVLVTIGNSLVNNGMVTVADNAVLFMEGGATYVNNGSIALNSLGSGANLVLSGIGDVTFSGSGSIDMGNDATNYIYSLDGTHALINNSTIQGAGNIGYGQTAIVNNGSIVANQSAGLTLQSAYFTNAGGISTSGAGVLTLQGAFSNSAGFIYAASGTSLTLDTGTTVTGGLFINDGQTGLHGSLRADSAENGSGATLSVAAGNSGLIGSNFVNGSGAQVIVADAATLAFESGGAYTNNGVIALNSAGNGSSLVLSGGAGNVTFSGAGSIDMSNNSGNAIYSQTGLEVLVNGVSHTIQGAGNIGMGQTSVVNNGTILANQSAGLTLQSANFVNNGAIAAAGNGVLTLQGVFDNSAGTVSVASGTQAYLTDGSLLSGGNLDNDGALTLAGTVHSTVTNTTTGVISVAASTLAELGGTLTNQAGGQIQVADAATLLLQSGGTYTNHGVISLNSAGSGSELVLTGGGVVTLNGSGTLQLSNDSSNYVYGQTGLETLVNGAGHTIRGGGNVGLGQTTIVNNGAIVADQTSGLSIQSTDVTNNGLIATAGAGVLSLVGSFDNTNGTISIVGGTTAWVGAGSTVTGGTFGLQGTLHLNGGTIQTALSNEGQLGVDTGSGSIAAGASSFLNSGTVLVSSGAELSVTTTGAGASYVQTSGVTQVDGILQTALLNIQGGTLQGTGAITGDVNNSGGTVAPGNSPGTLYIGGNYTQSAMSFLNIVFSGAGLGGNWSVLDITGSATLDGGLSLSYITGFTANVGDVFTFMRYGSRSGTFASAANMTYGNLLFSIVYNATTADLVVSSADAVPEPGTWLLITGSLLGLGLARRARRKAARGA